MKISRKKINKEQNGQLEINVIDNWLKDNGDPAIERLVKKNLAIANKIASLLESKGMKPADLAAAMGKQRSEVSKWLSGQHTFTTKTITKIEEVLAQDIIHIEPSVRNVYFTAYVRVEDIQPAIQEDIFEDSLYEEVSA
ncbi:MULTISPECIES: helix-turn-helix domain-containing protein [Olivibacter]|jgi:transcriptional regulator with XRE-family HTH domain|uniref:Helix-turn-helix domain-containing protein n=1 Tax=Olivibacter jilunii TaxID=985016 RepID=A0ABW6B960_9SPHI|nr:helix-turn-helix transcriptional regulator [Olivibacter jilunii]